MVVYASESHSRTRACSAGRPRTQSNSCHALRTRRPPQSTNSARSGPALVGLASLGHSRCSKSVLQSGDDRLHMRALLVGIHTGK